ncbi:MAG: hypothetical protein QUS11_03430 [Candidatus Fermentibacter sp.]|nr:hypothetical protein [Candidatus Fermentibacter sp.]
MRDLLTVLVAAAWAGAAPGAAGVRSAVLSNGLVQVEITASGSVAPAGSVTRFEDLPTGIDLASGGDFCALRCGSLAPMDGTLEMLSDTEAVFSSPGFAAGMIELPLAAEVTYRLVGRGMEVAVLLEATGEAPILEPLEMGMSLQPFDSASFSNQSGPDRALELTGTHGLCRISGDQAVRLSRLDGLLEARLVFPNPALDILALDDPPAPGPALRLRLLDTEPPRETAVGPDLHSILTAGREVRGFFRIALEPGFIPSYLSAHPSGLERTASWMLDDLPFRHPPDTTLWAFSESAEGGEWVSAWLIALLENHPDMKMNWIILPDAILAPNCDSMWAEQGFEQSWSHWHSVWRLADFAPPGYRQWLVDIQDDALPWAGQVTLGSHGYHHTPSPDSAWDPYHEFITYEPAEHMERFSVMRQDLAAIGLDNSQIRAMRFPGHRTSQSGLEAVAAYGFDFYCNGIRWYEQIGGEPFIDQYMSHYEEPGGSIWGSNTVWWGDYPPAPYEYATTVLDRGKHALLGCHPDRMFGWGSPAVFASIDSICSVFEGMPHFGWMFPEDYGLFLEEEAGIAFTSLGNPGNLVTASFEGSAGPGLTFVTEVPDSETVLYVKLDGVSIPWEARSSRIFVVLPALPAGGHSVEACLQGPEGVADGVEQVEATMVAVNPCSGSMRLALSGLDEGGAATLLVYDCAGRIVADEPLEDLPGDTELTVGLPGAPPGLYLAILVRQGSRPLTARTVLLP